MANLQKESRDILVLAHVHYPDEVRVRREVTALVSEGYQVDLLCLGKPGQPTREEQVNLNVIRLSLPKTRRSVLAYLWEYFSFCLGAACLTTVLYMRRRYRLIQVYNQPDFLIFAAFVPKMFGAKLVFDYRDAMPEGTMDKYQLSPHHPVVRMLRLVEQISMKFSDRILTVHQPFKNLLVTRGFDPSAVGVFMNLPDPKLFDRSRHPKRVRNWGGELRLIHHGTLNEIYNVGIALESLALIKRTHADVHVSLSIYGTGPDLPHLQALSEKLGLDNVHFGGRVSFEAIPRLIAQSDVGIVPTRHGPVGDFSLSNKLLEYVMMGKPVIASRLPTIRTVFGDTSLLFFDCASAEELAECILRLQSDPELFDQLVRSADADFVRFSWDRNQRQYLDFIAQSM